MSLYFFLANGWHPFGVQGLTHILPGVSGCALDPRLMAVNPSGSMTSFPSPGGVALRPGILSVLLTFYRLARGPSRADRVISIDLLTTFGIANLASLSLATDETTLLDVRLLLALVSFLGTVALAQYLGRETG